MAWIYVVEQRRYRHTDGGRGVFALDTRNSDGSMTTLELKGPELHNLLMAIALATLEAQNATRCELTMPSDLGDKVLEVRLTIKPGPGPRARF